MLFMITFNFSDGKWSLFSEEDSVKYYYDRTSIKEVEEDVIEVCSAADKPSGRTLRVLRIDCKANQFAIGLSYLYKKDVDIPYKSFDYSRRGWNWYPPSARVDKELIHAVCSEERTAVQDRL